MFFLYSSNRRGQKNARVAFLVQDTSSQYDESTYKVSLIHSIWAESSKIKNERVVVLVHDTSSQCDPCTCKVSRIYPIRFKSYGPDTVYCMELSQGVIIQKPKVARTKVRAENSKGKNARVVFLAYDTSSQCDTCTCKVS